MSINLQIAVARAKMLAKRHFHSAVDVLYAASLFTHLYPRDAQAYLREAHRVLRDGGRALVSFHDRPRAGETFSGDEHRADYDAAHFGPLCAQAGLRVAEDVGDVCGQRTFVLRKEAVAE